jgi:hypothetical protein
MAAPFGAEQGREREADRWGQVAQCCFKLIPFNLNRFKQILNCSNFNQSKKNLPKLKKFEIKYGVEGFDKRNNFPYINFFKSEVYFELKIKDSFKV